MTKVLLSKTYKARKPCAVLDIPLGEAESLVALGIGDIIKEEQSAPKKAGKGADPE